MKHIPEKIPVLVLAGGADELATADESREICACIPNHSELVIFEGAGAGHSGLCHADPERCGAVLVGFVDRCSR